MPLNKFSHNFWIIQELNYVSIYANYVYRSQQNLKIIYKTLSALENVLWLQM